MTKKNNEILFNWIVYDLPFETVKTTWFPPPRIQTFKKIIRSPRKLKQFLHSFFYGAKKMSYFVDWFKILKMYKITVAIKKISKPFAHVQNVLI